MDSLKRTSGNQALDSGAISNIGFNENAGVHKTSDFGKKLKPIRVITHGPDATTYTTDASSIKKIEKGMALALYNNAGAVASFRLSNKPTAASLAPGVTDSTADAGEGDVGVAVPPNSWHYTNSSDKEYIITSAATLLVYIVEDESRVVAK